MRKLITIIFLYATIIPAPVFGDWQSTLESNFSVVSTFDELQDWHMPGGDGYILDSQYQPVLTNGGPSIWLGYSTDGTTKRSGDTSDAISVHPDPYVWRGKGLCIDYFNFIYDSGSSVYDPTQGGSGPSRLMAFFGDGVSGDGGYDEIYIFFMSTFRDGFWIPNGTGTYYDTGVMKAWDLLTGFTEVGLFGAASEQSIICTSDPQTTREYGANFFIINYTGGGASTPYTVHMRPQLNPATNTYGDCAPLWRYAPDTWMVELDGNSGRDLVSVDNFYEGGAGTWFGVEIRAKVAPAVGGSDAEFEVWTYDSAGNVVGHHSKTGLTMPNQFDHNFTKFVIGGNRIGTGYGEGPEDSIENRVYYDDFVVDDARIGPTYFALLDAYAPTAPVVTAPSNQSIPGTSYTLSGASAVIESGRTVASCIWSSDQGESGSLSTSGTAPNITISGDISGLAQGTEDIVHTITITVVDAPNGETGDDTFDITVQGTGTGDGVTTVSNTGTARTISNTGTAQIVGN